MAGLLVDARNRIVNGDHRRQDGERLAIDGKGVREAAVIGVSDPVLGQAIKAFVVVAEGSSLTDKQVLAHCRAHLEDYMVPKHVEFRSELPKTSSGKITKTGLS